MEPRDHERPMIEVDARVPGAVVVSLNGDHDLSTRPAVEQTLESAVTVGRVLVDLSECTFMDASLVNALKTAKLMLDQRSGGLAVVIPRDARAIRRTARLARLTEIAPITESREAALATLLANGQLHTHRDARAA